MKKNKKKSKISIRKSFYALLIVFTVLIAILIFTDTFALFETKGEAVVNQSVGKWIIKVNNTNISTSQSQDFVIDNFNYSTNTKVKDGKIAPGRSGYFDIVIDPTGTEVSVLYTIEFDFSDSSVLSSSVSVLNGNSVVRTGENTYSGIISLSDINNSMTNSIRVYFDWVNNDANNDVDTEIGMSGDDISIPVHFNAIQYDGEVLVPYSE